MKCYPNCKINYGLNILHKRPDGYHDLATIFLPVPLCDELEITAKPEGKGCTLTLSGIPVDCSPEQNICVKAYNMLQEDFPTLPAVKIHLHKVVPFGAGLGGGSSDAAFTLRMLNDLFVLGLNPQQLRKYAARLGADCAFFIDNQPAYATGIGDVLTPLDKNPIEDYRLVLAKPADVVNTKEAYGSLTPRDQRKGDGCIEPFQFTISQGKESITIDLLNDFEASVFPRHPAIASLKDLFYKHGATFASMSGSGAAVFGLFPKHKPIAPSLLAELGNNLLYAGLTK